MHAQDANLQDGFWMTAEIVVDRLRTDLPQFVTELLLVLLVQWAVNAVMAVQATFAPLDEFLIFVSEATNPASVLHYLVPVSSSAPTQPP